MPDHQIFLLTLIFTVIYTSAAVLAIGLAWQQVRASIAISTREKALDAYVNFSDKYAELTRLSHEIDVRFHTQDQTLNEYDIKYFFNSFWVLQLQEWEFLQADILPVRAFAHWMLHTHEYLLSGKAKSYFEAGQPISITAKEGYEKYGRRVLRFHPDFLAFVRELEAIPYTPDVPNAAAAPLEALVTRYKRKNDYWRRHIFGRKDKV